MSDDSETATIDAPDDSTCEHRYKAFDAKDIEVKEGERAIVATINTGIVDRDREVVVPKGGRFATFRKNPVVLFGHAFYDPPVGKAQWIRNIDDTIVAKTILAPTEMGEQLLTLFQGGFLKAFSIGYDADAKAMGPPTSDEVRKNPDWADARMVFRKWDLLEYSVVSVPANPEALAHSVSKGKVQLAKGLIEALKLDLSKVKTVVAVPRKAEKSPIVRALPRPAPKAKTEVVTPGRIGAKQLLAEVREMVSVCMGGVG